MKLTFFEEASHNLMEKYTTLKNVVFPPPRILGLQPRDKATMLGVNTINFFLGRIYVKIKFGSQRREMLLFLTTNMATVTSRANQQL